jgi:hypothetical protein
MLKFTFVDRVEVGAGHLGQPVLMVPPVEVQRVAVPLFWKPRPKLVRAKQLQSGPLAPGVQLAITQAALEIQLH